MPELVKEQLHTLGENLRVWPPHRWLLPPYPASLNLVEDADDQHFALLPCFADVSLDLDGELSELVIAA